MLLTPTIAHLPTYLQDRALTWPRKTCIECGSEIRIIHFRNHKARATAPRVLVSRKAHDGKRFCCRSCSASFTNRARGPIVRKASRPALVVPTPSGALRFDPFPTPVVGKRPPTPAELEQLRACIDTHPLLARAFAGTLTDSWYPSGSTTAVGMKEAA